MFHIISKPNKKDPASALTRRTYSCDFSKGFVYCGSTYGVNVFELKKNGLKFVQAFKTEDSVNDLFVDSSGNRLFVSSGNGGIYLFSIEKPGKLKKTVSYKTIYNVLNILKIKNLLFVSEGTGGFEVIRIEKNDFEPIKREEIKEGYVRNIEKAGNLIIVSAGFAGFYIYDVETLKLKKIIKTKGEAWCCDYEEGILACSEGFAGVTVFKHQKMDFDFFQHIDFKDIVHDLEIFKKPKSNNNSLMLAIAAGIAGLKIYKTNKEHEFEFEKQLKIVGMCNKVRYVSGYLALACDYYGTYFLEVE